MAFLASLDVPVLSGSRQAVIYTLGVIEVAGLVVLLIGRFAKPKNGNGRMPRLKTNLVPVRPPHLEASSFRMGAVLSLLLR
jgi:hypothetical protein